MNAINDKRRKLNNEWDQALGYASGELKRRADPLRTVDLGSNYTWPFSDIFLHRLWSYHNLKVIIVLTVTLFRNRIVSQDCSLCRRGGISRSSFCPTSAPWIICFRIPSSCIRICCPYYIHNRCHVEKPPLIKIYLFLISLQNMISLVIRNARNCAVDKMRGAKTTGCEKRNENTLFILM